VQLITNNEERNKTFSAYSRAQYTISSLKFNQKKGEMLLLSQLLSVVVDIILFCVFFETNNYTIMKR
jgi:hypothetical protein